MAMHAHRAPWQGNMCRRAGGLLLETVHSIWHSADGEQPRRQVGSRQHDSTNAGWVHERSTTSCPSFPSVLLCGAWCAAPVSCRSGSCSTPSTSVATAWASLPASAVPSSMMAVIAGPGSLSDSVAFGATAASGSGDIGGLASAYHERETHV